MALFNSLIGLIAIPIGLAIFVIVLALIVDIVKWLRNPEEHGGLPE